MRDKELRKLLEKKGLIGLFHGYKLQDYDNEVMLPSFFDICKSSRSTREELKVVHLANRQLNEELSIVHDNLIILEAKFRAINKHYGITVEHEDSKYTVKEVSK